MRREICELTFNARAYSANAHAHAHAHTPWTGVVDEEQGAGVEAVARGGSDSRVELMQTPLQCAHESAAVLRRTRGEKLGNVLLQWHKEETHTKKKHTHTHTQSTYGRVWTSKRGGERGRREQ